MWIFGLVFDNVEYASVPGIVPAVAPAYPNILSLPSIATTTEALQARGDHIESKMLILNVKILKKYYSSC